MSKRLKYALIIAAIIVILIAIATASKAETISIKDLSKRKNMGARSIRNNNPGNIKINPANNWVGKVPESQNSDGVFEQFYEFKYGTRAMIKLLRNKINQGFNTVSKLINNYAPVGENTRSEVDAYIQAVSNALSVAPNDKIRDDKNTLRKLVISMSRFEAGGPSVTRADFNEAYNLL